MSADQDTIKSSTLRNFFIQKAEGLISVFTPLPNSVGFSLGSLCDAQQPIASPALLRLEKAGVSAGVLHDRRRSVEGSTMRISMAAGATSISETCPVGI